MLEKEMVIALQTRLKELSLSATPDELAYLARAMESLAGKSTVLDMVEVSEAQINKIAEVAEEHLKTLDTKKTVSLSAVDQEKEKATKAVDVLKTESLTLLDTALKKHKAESESKNLAHITLINTQGEKHKKELTDLTRSFTSTYGMKGSCPFIFGILSRNNDYWGVGNLNTALGKWVEEGADTMLRLLTGCHNYTHEHAGFVRPPALYFLQGKQGNFNFKEMYNVSALAPDAYHYPRAALGVFFIKNTTNAEIKAPFTFESSTSWHSEYAGTGVYTGTPRKVKESGSSTTNALQWHPVFNSKENSTPIKGTGEITVAAHTTIALLCYSSAYYHNEVSGYYNQFLHWCVTRMRSELLKPGLEIDIERTMRAYHCPGLEHTYDIWN